jgi:myo-inositol 2-dehydrogenase / D-chiro-inositol 1-dehydrogenase
VIGTGMMGIEHIENIRALDGATITAISDPNADSRAKGAQAAGLQGVAVFEDHRDLLSSGLCDAVVVASPNHTHVDVVGDVLATGLHAWSRSRCAPPSPTASASSARAAAPAGASPGWRWSTATWRPPPS